MVYARTARQDRPLQMQYAISDLLGAALIPELRTDIAARAAGDVQGLLVAVAAMRALPHQLAVVLHNLNLAVEAALLAVIALGVQLRVHDVVVDVLHDADDGLEVVLHVGHLDVGDGAARGEALELALELELVERVDLLGNMDSSGVP